ncbi:MAG: nuclease-related domain-containing protein, partial [Planctomycetota bacterium]
MAKIYRIGEPENEAERKAIRELADQLGDEYSIFHNFEITTRRGFPYEVDVLVIGSHAVYLLEVKGYRGRITGDSSRWRLEPGGASHANPIPLINTKARVLHDKMADKDPGVRGTLIVGLVLLTD